MTIDRGNHMSTENTALATAPHKQYATKHLGVKRANSGRFEARINLHGRYVHLGTFPTAAEAHAAYLTTKRNHHEGCTI